MNSETILVLVLVEEWEAKQKARERDSEDLIKKKHREADALKQQKLEQFKKQAGEQSEAKHLDMAEQHLRERVSTLFFISLDVGYSVSL